MGIRDVDAVPEPSHTFDRVFMDDLHIHQHRRIAPTDPPLYDVQLTFRMSCDDQPVVKYKNKSDTIVIKDYFAEAMELAGKGQPEMIEALGAIQVAVATLLKLKRSINTEVT